MRYLDYERLQQPHLDPIIRGLLVTVCATDSVRRVQVAFPEFFSDQKPYRNRQVSLDDMRVRYDVIDGVFDIEEDDELKEITDWFGIPLYKWEGREDDKQIDECIVLSADFPLARDSDYNGLKADDPWIVSLLTPERKEPEDHLVLKVLHVGDRSPEFFLWTISMSNILLKTNCD